VVKNFLPPGYCKEIIESLPLGNIVDSGGYTNLLTGNWYKNNITDQRCPLDLDNTILDKVLTLLPAELDCVADRMYVTKYNVGQSCQVHTDPADITVIILLNDVFEGGELVVGKRKLRLRQGDAVVFSDRLLHSVFEITHGERYALSVWLNVQKHS
jgi:hypothetical protein